MNGADLGLFGLFGNQSFPFAQYDRSSNWKNLPAHRKMTLSFGLAVSARFIDPVAMNSVRVTAFFDRRN
jgi:hypothetical protein